MANALYSAATRTSGSKSHFMKGQVVIHVICTQAHTRTKNICVMWQWQVRIQTQPSSMACYGEVLAFYAPKTSKRLTSADGNDIMETMSDPSQTLVALKMHPQELYRSDGKVLVVVVPLTEISLMAPGETVPDHPMMRLRDIRGEMAHWSFPAVVDGILNLKDAEIKLAFDSK
mgnify:CR=1 FL=1